MAVKPWDWMGSFNFYKKFWPQISTDVMDLNSHFYVHGRLQNCIKSSFLTLITKKERPSKLKDFRPISLIRGLQKIIFKLLVGRLQSVIH